MDFQAHFFAQSDSQPIGITGFFTREDVKFQNPEIGQINWPVSQIRLQFLIGSQKLIMSKVDSDFPNLLVEDEAVSALIIKNWPIPKNKPSGRQNSILKPLSAFILFVLFLAGFLYFFWKASPIFSDFFAEKIPIEWEIEVGDRMFDGLMKTEKMDSVKTNQLQEFYSQLLPLPETSKERQRNISLTVVSNPEFNAFALPGRHIVVNSGVFSRVQSPGQLMALIGHESGHIENRHSIRSLVRAGALYAIISLVFGDLTGLSAIFIDNAQSIQTLSYSRDFEREADLESHRFLCQNSVNPQAVIELMEILNELAAPIKDKNWSFLQSHPQTEERIKSAKMKVKENPCSFNQIENSRIVKIFKELKHESTSTKP